MSNFKKTVSTVLLFFLAVVLFSIGITEVFFSGENFYYQDAHERDELSGTLDFLVCGSSHAMRSMKPDILDEELGVNSYNLSVANTSMQGRYEMLKVELARNPVDTVILGVSYNSMTRTREDKGYEGDYYVLSKLDFWHRVPYFFESIEPSEYISIYYEFLSKGFDCIDMVLQGTWTSYNDKIDKGYVSFDSLQYEEEEEDRLVKDYSKIFNTKELPEEINEKSVGYLNKIVELCEEQDVRLIMISVPLSETFITKYKNLDVFLTWYQAYAEEKGIPFYDFNLYKENVELYSDEVDFHDVRHLNDIGSDKFSEVFCSVYTQIKDGKDVGFLFYNSYEELKEVYKSEFENE